MSEVVARARGNQESGGGEGGKDQGHALTLRIRVDFSVNKVSVTCRLYSPDRRDVQQQETMLLQTGVVAELSASCSEI